MKHKCPICKKAIKASAGKKGEKPKFYPFCSERCKLIDLGAWLDAKYKIISKTQKQTDKEDSSQ
jgi:endogenous inhibitor of DNA gyrase (YacG/DUF329 family)